MKNREALEMQGRLRFELRDAAGQVAHSRAVSNHIVLSGRDLVAKMFILGGFKPISHLAVGKGDQPVTPDDTHLADEVERVAILPFQIERDLTEVSTDDGKDKRKKVIISAKLGFAQANTALTEAALFNEDNIMYNRVVFAPAEKTEDFTLTLVWEITF